VSKIRKALFHSSVSQYGANLIALVSTMIVARLLTPDQLGVFAIASGLVMILSEFKLLGAGEYLVREAQLSENKIRSALGLTVLISWSLGLAVAGSAEWMAGFYRIPSLSDLFYILSVTFILSPFISITVAQANRSFNFSVLLQMNLAASLLSLVATVVLISLGFGIYSLAWALVIRTLVEMLVVMLNPATTVFWRPEFRGVGKIAKFGVFNSTANVVSKGIQIVPDMVIGKLGTTMQVGLFSRGLGFIDFIGRTMLMGISPVALPYLSETLRQGGDVIVAYTRACVLLSAVLWPVLTVAAIASLPTIRVFFGPQWDAAAPIATFMAIWLILRSTHGLANKLFVATGNEKITMVKELVLLILAVTFVISAFPFGLNAIASSFVLLGIIELVLVSWLLKRFLALDYITFYKQFFPNVLISVICGLTTWGISFFISFESEPAWKPVLAIFFCLPVTWLGSLFLFKHPLASELGNLTRRAIS